MKHKTRPTEPQRHAPQKHKGLSGLYTRTCKGLCERVSQKRRNEKVYPLLAYAGIEENYDLWLGKRMLLAILAFAIGALLPWSLGEFFIFGELGLWFLEIPGVISISASLFVMSLVVGLLLAGITAALFYLHLFYMIEGRAKMVEEILPDFLTLVSSNIRAGMTPFAAFRTSARKEFGPLSKEIQIATSKSLGTESFSQALHELGTRIQSTSLSEIVAFFAQSLKSGGKISKLLETSAEDLRQNQEMKKELLASTKMYVMFVVFVVVVGAPLLLGVGVQFLEMVTAIQAEGVQGGAEIASVGFLAADLAITPSFMYTMSFILLFGNAILSSLFIGVLTDAKAKMGLKYMPVILAVSVGVFMTTTVLLAAFLG